MLDAVAMALREIRKAKSEAQLSMRADIAAVAVTASPADASRIELAAADLASTGRVGDLTVCASDEVQDTPVVTVTL